MANKKRNENIENKLIHIKDNFYKIPYRRFNGLPGNTYYVKVPCNICGKICYQLASNAHRYKPVCSSDCHYNHKIRKNRIKKPGSRGQYYVQILALDHPYKNRHGRIYEHRYVMEQMLGRILKPNERVHHINMIKCDNKIENLFLFCNHIEHSKAHGSLNAIVSDLIKEKTIIFDEKERIYKIK